MPDPALFLPRPPPDRPVPTLADAVDLAPIPGEGTFRRRHPGFRPASVDQALLATA